jgi:hypothetical protein
MEDLTMKVGLLMEAAQSQQSLASTALEHLREHTGSLDTIVRDEIRATLIEELQALSDDSRRAAECLERLQRAAGVRAATWSVGIVVCATAIPLLVVSEFLPSRSDIAALRLTRAQLESTIERLNARGGQATLRRCGVAQRLCVRVERSAPAYGEGGDYLVIKGY